MERYRATTRDYNYTTLLAKDAVEAYEAAIKLFGKDLLTIELEARTKRIEKFYTAIVMEQAVKLYEAAYAAYRGK